MCNQLKVRHFIHAKRLNNASTTFIVDPKHLNNAKNPLILRRRSISTNCKKANKTAGVAIGK